MSWEIELLEKSKLAKEASAKLNILSTYEKDQTVDNSSTCRNASCCMW